MFGNLRIVEFEFDGRSWWAYCPAAAVFDIYEHFPEGESDNIVDRAGFAEHTRDGWDACCWLLAEFVRWGELWRRSMGETPMTMLTVSRLQLAAAVDMPRLKDVCAETVAKAFARDVDLTDDGAEVDLVLKEIEEKERKKSPPRGIFERIFSRHAPEI